jgi:hypothetical protein
MPQIFHFIHCKHALALFCS